LIYWPKIKKLNVVPAPFLVVALGIGLAIVFKNTNYALSKKITWLISHYLMVGKNLKDCSPVQIFRLSGAWDVWIIAGTIAVVASLETLLGIEAVDKMDPIKRDNAYQS
jgi:MFS superfamily sulfate permease-like transporter